MEAEMVTFHRRLPKFDYIKPKDLGEALKLLSNNPNGAYKIYAGGTDLIPRLRRRLITTPELLIDLKGLEELDYIHYDQAGGLAIGPLATIQSVACSNPVKEHFPMLSKAAESIASTQIQNRGTIAGNVCSAVPSADSIPALLCLEAQLVCANSKAERILSIEEFFLAPHKNALRPDEMLKEIRIPPMPPGAKGTYLKLSPRSKMDLAVVGVAAMVVREEEIFRDARIGLGAVSPTPMRAKRAERMLTGAKVNNEVIEKAAEAASDESSPISDHRGSLEYRKEMVKVLTKRAINQVLSV
jgi:aerobic carbon-monoxide dehydrogenase medium subunit